MSGKGFEPHKHLKIKADFLGSILMALILFMSNCSTVLCNGYRAGNVEVQFYEIKSRRDIFPDIEFVVWEDIGADSHVGGKEGRGLVVIIECEVNPNSNLLSDGIRKTAYKLLKETHKEWFRLILAKYKGVEVSEPEMFDEIWEFEKPSFGVRREEKG